MCLSTRMIANKRHALIFRNLKSIFTIRLQKDRAAFTKGTTSITFKLINLILVTARRNILVCRELLHECLGDCPLFLLNHCLYLLQ